MIEGRVVIGDCGCWRITSYQGAVILRSSVCAKHIGVALDILEDKLYLDKVGSVSAPEEEEDQLWLT